ncbi:MAG: GNAT family N-acetyltransferase [Novosphingobium sp.]|nr:GNAT family N-acetyltransferase [Novosphingobium sp.]MCP5402921.1 GNAT family N-acetyltransferase [Novosphingobium sp.]
MSDLDCSGSARRGLSVRLARDAGDLSAVQRLRWQVFFAERGAASVLEAADHTDRDDYDPLCDHLLVIDEDACEGGSVVGTYRLLRESVAMRHSGFYSAAEFDIGRLVTGPARPAGELLELGRSCVLPQYRTSATIQLLWRGIASYIADNNIGLMFGCASFAGTDPAPHAAALSYLCDHHLAAPEHRPVVREGMGIPLQQLAPGSYDVRKAMFSLPPLLKGYLRVGAKFGEGAFVDHDFNTIDVCVVMPVEQISQRYAARFSVAA